MSVQAPTNAERTSLAVLADKYNLSECMVKGIKDSYEHPALPQAKEAKKEKKALKNIFSIFVASSPEKTLEDLVKIFGKGHPYEMKKAQEWSKKFERKGRPNIEKYLGKFEVAKEALLQNQKYLEFRETKKQMKTEVIERVRNEETPQQIQTEIVTANPNLNGTSVVKKVPYWAKKA